MASQQHCPHDGAIARHGIFEAGRYTGRYVDRCLDCGAEREGTREGNEPWRARKGAA